MIAAALELGRRRQTMDVRKKIKITQSRLAYEAIAPLLLDKTHEEFWVLFLNRSNVVVERSQISTGGVSGTLVDPKIIFQKALSCLASGMILCHNHPSGQLKPSQADLDLTQKIKQGGQLLDIQVLDHLIVGQHDYLSMADEGLIF